MPRTATKTATKTDPPSLVIARRLRGVMVDDAEYGPDDVPAETPGAFEPGAMFHLETADGRVFRVRVNRIS